jgi:hypothetical protein
VLQVICSATEIIADAPYYLGKRINSIIEKIPMSVNLYANGLQNMKSKTHACERAFTHFKTFFQRLMLRKQMGLLQVEIGTKNELKRSVTPIQMIGIGIGGLIGR